MSQVPTHPPIRRMARLAFRTVVVLLWIAIICTALEAVFDIHQWYVVRNNPYIKGFGGKTPWPNTPPPAGAWQGSADLVEAAKVPMESVRAGAPVVDAVAERTRRATFFTELNDDDRGRFAALYGARILVCDRDGGISKDYPTMPLAKDAHLADALGQTDADVLLAPLRQAFDSGVVAWLPLASKTEAGNSSRGALLYPLKGADGIVGNVVVFVDSPQPNQPPVPAESLWDLPFLAYKKHVVSPNGRMRINNMGFRDDDVLIPKPKGLFRIVCIGGSTTEEGDTNAMTYPNLLERRLQRVFGTNAIEVVNCGLSGMNSSKEWMRAPDYLAVEPDLVIYYNGVNDICHRLCPIWVHEAPWWARLLRHSRFANFYLNRWLLPPDAAMAAEFDKEILSNLRALNTYFAKHRVPMAVCSFASPDIRVLSAIDRAYYDWSCEQNWGGRYVTFATYWRSLQLFNERIRAMCQGTGMMYIPVSERFNDGTYYFGDICHMKNEGIDLKAQAIFDGIQEYLQKTLLEQTHSRTSRTIANEPSIAEAACLQISSFSHPHFSPENGI